MNLSSPSKPSRPLWRRSGFFAFILLGISMILLLAVVQVQHQVRLLETKYSDKLMQQKNLQEEWGRLSLERNHLTAPARVEHLATQKLGMHLISNSDNQAQVIFIKPVMSDMSGEPMVAGTQEIVIPTVEQETVPK
nr:cell division protein FtsL [Thiosulfativibrio zosterae]